MPKEITLMGYRELIRRLRLCQRIRAIHRDTGYSREFIRKVKRLAEDEGWLRTDQLLPSEDQINRVLKTDKKPEVHRLDSIRDKIRRWVEQDYTYVVITELVNRCGFNYNEITIRRYIKKNFLQRALTFRGGAQIFICVTCVKVEIQ